MPISVEIQAEAAIAELRRIGIASAENALLSAVGDRFLAWIDDNFRRKGAEIPWAPLRPNTIVKRRKGSAEPLQDTGRMRQSVSRKVIGSAVQIGYASRIAEFHHFGTSRYIIRPVRARMLKFPTTSGIRYARFVRHPGLPARRLLPLEPTAERIAAEEVNAIFERAKKA